MDDLGEPRWCVTANFQQYRRGSRAWLERAVADRRPAIVFGQEMPDLEWLGRLAGAKGYTVIRPSIVLDSRWHIVSWLLVADELGPRAADPQVWRGLAVHESYAAAAQVTWPGLGELLAVSMHASPNPVPAADLGTWPISRTLLRTGAGDPRHAGAVWYSDLYLNALADLVGDGRSVLAAGDLNEARAWDATHPGNWGRDFFANVDRAGLVDVTYSRWREERQTRFHSTHPRYQLDIVLASGLVDAQVSGSPEVDSEWADIRTVEATELADHAPVWFQLR